jgi:hypothetical protein
MIRGGFLPPEDRTDLIALARDGSVAHRLGRRANALVACVNQFEWDRVIRLVALLATEATMAVKEILVKKYVVRLSGEERERLEALIRKGKNSAQRLLKARMLFPQGRCAALDPGPPLA